MSNRDSAKRNTISDILGRVRTVLDMRKIRAYFVAAFYKIVTMGHGIYEVTRPDGSVTYKVEVRKGFRSCSCPDARTRRGAWCKHSHAIKILTDFFGNAMRKWKPPYEIPLDNRPKPPPEAEAAYYKGARRRQPVVLPFPKGSREATRRNRARIEMPARCVALLWMLCQKAMLSHVSALKAKKPLGRRGAPTVLRLFFTVFRVLRNASYEKAKEDLLKHLGSTVTIDGATPKSPSKNRYAKYIHDPALTPLLEECLRLTARVVRKIEKAIVIDATAFSTCQTENWLDSNHGKKVRRPDNVWLKAHTASGAVTDVVAALLTSTNLNEGSADVNFFERLLDIARTTWNTKWVLADKGYLSNDSIVAAAARKMTAIIPVKVNWKDGKSPEARSLIQFYNKHDGAAFDEIYRYRTKIESVFSAIKRTCGYHARTRFLPVDQVKARSDAQHVGTGRRNELLAKFVAHNLRRLVWLEHRHNDTVDFHADRAFEPLPFERDGDNPFDAAA